MKKKNFITICFGLMLFCGLASAAITFEGAVIPATPAEWNDANVGSIGYAGTGTVTMTESTDSLAASTLYVGHANSSVGTLNMSGGSTLTTATSFIIANGTATHTTGKGYVYLDGAGTKLTAPSSNASYIGKFGTGYVSVKNGAQLETGWLNLASGDTSVVGTGRLVVEGAGSKVKSPTMVLGHKATSSASQRAWLDILDGGKVEIADDPSGKSTIFVGYVNYSNPTATVDGAGSTLSAVNLEAGRYDMGRLVITNSGLVTVSGLLCMNVYGTVNQADICMATRGKLALYGNGSANLDAFFGLMGIPTWEAAGGAMTNVIKYDASGIWTDIHSATPGVDYNLAYITSGDLAGYTVLTVPEPATVGLLTIGMITLFAGRNKKA